MAAFLLVDWGMTSRPIYPPTITPEIVSTLQTIVPKERIFTGSKTEKFSKDFYWYSPILKRLLLDRRAEVAIRIDTREELRDITALFFSKDVPVVIRGGGSGNYGQLIPLYGGAVLDISGMSKIFSVDGVVRAEAGATLRAIEFEARKAGWELRCMPSTWAISSIGGFFCGGSGGIGSILHGGISSGDNVKSVTIMTMESEPKFIKFEENDAIKALHTYGTTGIMVEVEMRLGKAFNWEQLIFVHDNWHELLDWTYSVATDDKIVKRLVTVFEAEICSYFKPLKKFLPDGKMATFLMVDEPAVEALLESAKDASITHVYSRPFGNPPKPPFITDYTWNHTTLWAIKANPNITYLQCGFGENFSENLDKLKNKYGDEFLLHLELTLGNAKFESGNPGVTVGGIPLIKFTTEERLNEIIDFCKSIGVGIANPHTYKLEEGGVHPDIKEKRALKAAVDPKALLNPGKMVSYHKNPFEAQLG